MALEKTKGNAIKSLLKAINDSNPQRALEIYKVILAEGGDPQEVHRSLYPTVQRVLNPPYINPHLPKMYAIQGELARYLKAEDIPALVNIEITEYARRPKLEDYPRSGLPKSRVTFRDIETAIQDRDRETAATLMAGFHVQAGGREFARRLLILGSGYLNDSLGHSISCTAFMLREMLERNMEEPWPVIFALAHYFCRGRFQTSPGAEAAGSTDVHIDSVRTMGSATSGRGIVNLHHTITFYALDRVRHLFNEKEYRNLFRAAVHFIGDKKGQPAVPQLLPGEPLQDYVGFFEIFSTSDTETIFSSILQMTSSKNWRRVLGRYLVKGVCDLYQGDYNPHVITGLGSLLWVLEKYPEEEEICKNALYQYLDYFYSSL